MRRDLVLPAMLATVASVASTTTATDWVLDRDFSITSNPNGQWTYGVYLEDAFNAQDYPDGWYTWPTYNFPTDPIGYYGNPGWDLGAGAVFYTNSDTPVGGPTQWWAPRKVMLHPAAYGGLYAPVIRWTAPANMRVSIDALFYGCEETTTDVHILLNGTMWDGGTYTGIHVLDGNIIGNYGYAPLGIAATNPDTNHVAYSGAVDIGVGDTLDFVCGYGGNGYASDLTGLDVTITKIVDLPATTEWVLDQDFSRASNPQRRWSYGVYMPDGSTYIWPAYYSWPGSEGQIGYWGNAGGDLGAGVVFYTESDTPLGGAPPANQWWAPHKVMLHPAAYGYAYAPLIRWTAPMEMVISVDARFYGCEETTTDVHVLLNGGLIAGSPGGPPAYSGTHLLDGVIEGNYGYAPLGVSASGASNSVAYQGALHLAAGDKLDFVVSYGANGSHSYDLTGLDVTITATCNLIWADMDGDADVDQADFGEFQACYTGSIGGAPLPAKCRCLDTAGDTGLITVEDFNAFMACWTGPTIQSTGCP